MIYCHRIHEDPFRAIQLAKLRLAGLKEKSVSKAAGEIGRLSPEEVTRHEAFEAFYACTTECGKEYVRQRVALTCLPS